VGARARAAEAGVHGLRAADEDRGRVHGLLEGGLRRGEDWERVLDMRHAEYRFDRRAVIMRAHAEVRIHRRIGSRVVASVGRAGPPDYVGMVCTTSSAPAIPVVADAKSTGRAGLLRAGIERHQALDLEACVAGGGWGLLLVRLGAHTERPSEWVVRWEDVADWWWGTVPGAWVPSMGGVAMTGGDWLGALSVVHRSSTGNAP
jgi:hypothetical protein